MEVTARNSWITSWGKGQVCGYGMRSCSPSPSASILSSAWLDKLSSIQHLHQAALLSVSIPTLYNIWPSTTPPDVASQAHTSQTQATVCVKERLITTKGWSNLLYIITQELCSEKTSLTPPAIQWHKKPWGRKIKKELEVVNCFRGPT